jgi:hypothetical protein
MPFLCKRAFAFILAFAAALCLAACEKPGAAESNLTGTPEEILTSLNESIAAAGVEAPMTMIMGLDAENAQNNAGLSAESFEAYVTSASFEAAAISTFAHQMAVIQAKDAASALEVKALISGEGGFNPQKWICVVPEKVLAVESGSYVLLVAAKADYCDAAVAAFTEAAGNVGETNVFFEGA